MADVAVRALRAMPLEAVAPLIDALLEATGIEASAMLYDVGVSLVKEMEGEAKHVEVFIAAVLHLLRASGGNAEDELVPIAELICIPHLSVASPMSRKASRLLAEGVDAKSAWDYALASLVPCCLKSISGEVTKPGELVFPLPVACQLVADLLMLAHSQADPEATNFFDVLVELFWHQSLELLSSALDDSVRSLILQTLMPCLLKGHSCKIGDVWSCCKLLLSSGSSQQRDAYRFLSMLKPHVQQPHATDVDILKEPQFWKELRNGLVNEDSLTRKRALYVLKFSLNVTETKSSVFCEGLPPSSADTAMLKKKTLSKRDKWAEQEANSLGIDKLDANDDACWSAFLFLYDILEDYGIHLIEAAWKAQMDVLMVSMSSCQGMQTIPVLDFSWISVLFERGFKHGNPQVRRMIFKSFLGIPWTTAENVSSVVPQEFVLGNLLEALNDPAQHKDFGFNGIYSSETAKESSQFFQAYSSCLSSSERVCFVNKLCETAAEQSLCRAGLMALVHCVEASSVGGSSADSKWIHLLDNLRALVENSRQHFNSSYRIKVCRHILHIVQNLILPEELPFDKLSQFLASFPRDLLISGGPLYSTCSLWLNSSGKAQKSIVNGLQTGLETFLRPPEGKLIGDDDVKSWREQADVWARLVNIGVHNEQQQLELLSLVEENALEIYQHAYMPPSVPEKILLLVQSLVKEYPRSSESDLCSSLHSHLVDFLTKFMVELMSHAKKCARVFWQYELVGPVELPASLTGRLGGASQRRLPCQAASVVLQGVLALETLAECVIWLTKSCENRIHDWQFSVGSFLWELCFKILGASQLQEEIRGELCLAGLEALVSVCKCLPFVSSAEIRDNLQTNGYILEVQPEKVVDALVRQLLQVSSDILNDGKLARSRISVLALHKWSCLDGLLCILSPAFSASVLQLLLRDCIESLGSAGEGYLLPLFRCLRRLMQYGAVDQEDRPVQIMWELVHSGWTAVADCNKRKAAPIAAFLSALLHPAVFSNSSMHGSPDNEGPLKWLINRLIELGSRSPRTMRLTALHLTGLWLEYPVITAVYTFELQLLSLHGGENVDEELDGEILEHENTIKEFATAIRNSDPELLEVFANTEMFARVSVAVMMDKLGNLVETRTQSDAVAAAESCGRSLLFNLLVSASDGTDLGKELYKKKSIVHRRKVRAWQILCILSRFTDENILPEVIRLLECCLLKNNMPSVRQYIEIFAVQIYLRFPFLVRQHLVPSLYDCGMKTQALSSYVFIAANVVMRSTSADAQVEMIKQVLPAMLPHMTSHHHNLRTFSQVLIFHVLEICHRDPTLYDQLGTKCLLGIGSYLEKNQDCVRVRQSVDEFLHSLDPIEASRARGIFCQRRLDPSKTLEERPFECVPISVVDQVAEFLNDARGELRESMASEALALSLGKAGVQLGNGNSDYTDYQKKIIPFFKTMQMLDDMESEIEHEDDLLLSAIEKRGRELAKNRKGRQELIVVASLIDRIPNLAGLARTCEVFKAAALTVADARILEDRQFKLISVSADQWVPILEVTEAALDEFLKKKKKDGYAILGLEQTAKSVRIDSYPFPRRAVLVLGHEKEGIPVDIIQLLDACVEIPQLGVIRSLNVHVSGAIAIWEYTRQHPQHA